VPFKRQYQKKKSCVAGQATDENMA